MANSPSPEDRANLLKAEIERLRRKDEEQANTIKALQEEFSKAAGPDDIVETARNAIVELMPKAIIQMGTLIEHAESESVRASLSKFVVATALDKTKFEDSSSGELKKLLEQVSSNTQDSSESS